MEKTELDDMMEKSENIHKFWRDFAGHFMEWYYSEVPDYEVINGEIIETTKLYKQFDPSKMIGYECMNQIDEYVKDHPEIKVVGVDDDYFTGSYIVLVPHPKMGITAIYVPQNGSDNNFFLYSGHARNLIEALEKMEKEIERE